MRAFKARRGYDGPSRCCSKCVQVSAPRQTQANWKSVFKTDRVVLRFRCTAVHGRARARCCSRHPRGGGAAIGVVRAVADPDGASAEFAILIRSDLKGRGLGTVLMRKMIRYCQTRGIGELVGEVLTVNQPMLALAGDIGFDIQARADGATTRVRLRLGHRQPDIRRSRRPSLTLRGVAPETSARGLLTKSRARRPGEDVHAPSPARDERPPTTPGRTSSAGSTFHSMALSSGAPGDSHCSSTCLRQAKGTAASARSGLHTAFPSG